MSKDTEYIDERCTGRKDPFFSCQPAANPNCIELLSVRLRVHIFAAEGCH